MSLLNLLFSRADHDQAVELFLSEVFLHAPFQLKSFRLVSKEWNNFIKLKIWRNKRTKRSLFQILFKSLKSQKPVKRIDIHDNFSLLQKFVSKPPCIQRILCDDEILLLSEEEADVKRLHMFSLVTSKQHECLELDKEDNSVNEIRFSIGPSYFCTILTRDKWLHVWTKSGTLVDSIIIGKDLGYLRLLKAVRSMIFVVEVDRCNDISRVFISKYSEQSLKLEKAIIAYEILDITRAIESNGQDDFYTAHQHVVKVWQIGKNHVIKTLHTGLVVDMVFNNGYLVTIGSAQNLGVHIWDIESGGELKSLSLSDSLMRTSFERITLGVNQILLDGYRQFLLLFNSDKNEFTHQELGAHVCHSMLAMGKTKFVTIFPTNLTDKANPAMTICDYWNDL